MKYHPPVRKRTTIECNATSEDEEQNQKENEGISPEKSTTQQLCEVPQTSVTGKREEGAESELNKSENNTRRVRSLSR